GPTLTFFFLRNTELLGSGQVVDDEGALSTDPGFRMYARAEFNIWGAMYHAVDIRGKNLVGADTKETRQHPSGKQGAGLGLGALYGLHRNIDLGAEIMFDTLWPTVAYNFDFQLGLQFHF
ncbi:MAG: hypothetical protein PHU25_04465, partial [Deltaproteobacteria bacterium]|nr:hypothetical protein [Deltaproteobacteria bacterium]